MNRTARAAVGILVALMVAWLSGWIMGRAGKPALQATLDSLELHLTLTDARSRLLEARVDLYNVNFGNASRAFEEAKVFLRRASQRLATEGPESAVPSIGTAIKQAEEGQALANKLDQTANARAAQAVAAIDAVLGALR